MYKFRIKKWGLDKKHKEHEARAIIHMHTSRLGKATRIRLRGQSVDINNVLSYFKRKRIAIEDVLSSEAATLQDLVCETPVMSPRPMPQRTLSAELHCLESPRSIQDSRAVMHRDTGVHSRFLRNWPLGVAWARQILPIQESVIC
jgi:hypothetical protein